MGARIEAAGALTGHRLRRPNARRLADAAACTCLTHAGRAPGEVDMLINTGAYREDNTGEPALAALVQQDIGANPARPPAGGHGTFSFDLSDGVCGVIDAIRLEAGLLRSGVIRLGAIVTSDVHPHLRGPRPGLFRPSGGALLLSWDDGIAGFTDFHTETFPEYEDLLASGLAWRERRRRPHRLPRRAAGKSLMAIDEKAGYQARLVDCAEEATHRFLRRLGMGIGDIDLFVPAPSPAAFLDPLGMRLGVPGDRVAYVAEDLDGAYTSGPVAALQAAMASGRFWEARTIMMLAGGGGITVSRSTSGHLPVPPEPARACGTMVPK